MRRRGWPPSLSLTNGCIDLFVHWRLATNGWTHLAQVDVSGAQSNAVVELQISDFPTNAMTSTAFFRATDQSDSDGTAFPTPSKTAAFS